MGEVKHVPLNTLGLFPVAEAYARLEPEGWQLERVVQATLYETIAVFTRKMVSGVGDQAPDGEGGSGG